MKKSIEVNILNHKYLIKCDEGDEYVNKVIDYVNKKIKEITEKTKMVATVQIAVLTALNIADDCLKLEGKISKVEDRSKNLVNMIDERIGD